MTNETTTSKMKNDGFMTPNTKHVASSAALATSTMEDIEMNNAYVPLKLQSLGTTRGLNSSSEKDLSPSSGCKNGQRRTQLSWQHYTINWHRWMTLDSMRNDQEKSMQALVLLDEWLMSQHPLRDTRIMKEFRTTM
jgi:hypothetical protein